MISFSQLLLLVLILFLLFGDLTKFSQRILVFFIQLKKMVNKKENEEKKSH